MNKAIMFSMTAGSIFALGAGVAYLFDAQNGKRRRATLRDKALHAARKMKTAVTRTERGLANRTTGLTAEWRSRARTEKPDDEKLACRIRTRLGRLVSHPHSIQIEVDKGVVTVKGLALAEEASRLLHTIRTMEGVESVRDEVLVCRKPEHVSGLQGGRPRGKLSWLSVARHWPPAVRLIATVAGAAGFLYGIQRKDEAGLGVAIVSMMALLKGFSDQLWGIRNESVRFEDTIRIHAPLSDVFDFWADPRNYPRAMSHVRQVEKVGENLYHWTVNGPAGASVGWDATITENIPNTLLGWKSIEGSLIRNEGIAFLDPIYDGSTRLHIRMRYQLPGGLAGRIIASALGADPAKIIRKDLSEFKRGMERHANELLHGATGMEKAEMQGNAL